MRARFKFFALLWLYSGLAHASWTGISLELANVDSDWQFDNDKREAQISAISFKVEEKAQTELRVGAEIGYLDMRVVADTSAGSQKFDGEFLKVFLRQPFSITERISLHGLLSLGYHSGSESGDADDRANFDWTETKFEIGVSVRVSSLRITPYASYVDIDGDISDDDGTEVFEMDEPQSQGIRFDYFVEDSAFIRVEFIGGGQVGGYLTFARQY